MNDRKEDENYITRETYGNGFFGKNFFSYTFAAATLLSLAIIVNVNNPGMGMGDI